MDTTSLSIVLPDLLHILAALNGTCQLCIDDSLEGDEYYIIEYNNGYKLYVMDYKTHRSKSNKTGLVTVNDMHLYPNNTYNVSFHQSRLMEHIDDITVSIL